MPIPSIKIVIAGVDKFSATLGSASKSISKFGAKTTAVGKSMTMALTLPIVAFGALTLKTAGDFETSMNQVQNLTNATGQEMVDMTKQARKLGATTQFTASEAASAMGFLGMAGFKTNQILSSMPGTLNLAAASGMQLGEAADIASNILTGFNLKAEEMGRVSDVMTATFQNSNTNALQLGEAMKYVAPLAAGAGVKFEEVSAAVGLLGNAGIQAAMAGTTLRKTISTLLAPSAEAIGIFKKFGIKKSALYDSNNQLRSLTEVVRVFEKSGVGAGDMMQIFGERAGPGMIALMSQGSAALSQFTEKLDKSSGTALKAQEVRMKGLNGELKKLKSVFEELMLVIAESGILSWATKLVIKVTNLITKMTQLSPSFMKWATIIALVVAAIGPLLMVIGGFLSGLGAIMSIAPMVATVLGGIATALVSIVSFLGVAGTLFVAAAAIWIYNIMLIRKNWEGLVEIFTDWSLLLGTIKIFITDIATSLARLALPKFLEKKFGLTAEVTPANSIAPTSTAAAIGGNGSGTTNRSEVKVSFDNVPKGTRITAPRSVALSTYFGQTFAGAE